MSDNRRRFIVLDRDGVINEDSDEYIKSPAEWIPIPGSLDAIAALGRAGFRIAVATNQSGVGRGLYTVEILEAIHEKMINSIKATGGTIDGIFFCPHLPDAGCDCRKPKPGLLLQAAKLFDCGPADIQVIGDSMRDIEAAKSIGAEPILVRSGYGRETEKSLSDSTAVPVFNNLADAARALISRLP